MLSVSVLSIAVLLLYFGYTCKGDLALGMDACFGNGADFGWRVAVVRIRV